MNPVRNFSPAIAGLETERGIISNGVNLSAEFNATTGFIQFLKTKIIKEKLDISIASESSLKKDWLRPEEDEAWQSL